MSTSKKDKSGRRASTAKLLAAPGVTSLSTESTMFGDLFQARANYTTGLFYAGRRRYIHSEQPGNSRPSALLPPTEFMTIRQRRDFLRHERGGITSAGLQRLEFKKVAEVEDRPHKAIQAKNAAMNEAKYVTIEKYPSVDPRDWREEEQAGCKFYVHKLTGEACSEKPWEAVNKYSTRQHSRIIEAAEEKENIEEFGTGSLVYDSTELKALLDSLEQQKSNSEEHSRPTTTPY